MVAEHALAATFFLSYTRVVWLIWLQTVLMIFSSFAWISNPGSCDTYS